MQLTRDTATHRTTITVTVRVPNGAGGDLTSAAASRLGKPTEVHDVRIEGLQDLDPGLSATAVTARVTLELPQGVGVEALSDCQFVTVAADGDQPEDH